ncbi:MAG TPA: thrombospondin type 3 repeat-containing protein, partial [Nannocystaceae bacterium]|nr:thrombospondin type 3 repeat-containing protein [Nannocystaceae bacterium]
MWERLAALAVAGSLATLAISGCVEDVACGVCDDKNLVLQILSGPNYALENVKIVSPQCEGERCPAEFDRASYFVESIGPCEETDAALASVRGVKEYCKIAPVVVSSGLQFVFNNLLDPSYVETVRTRPDNPNLFETYDWKTRILSVKGPVTRYAGDWRTSGSGPHIVTRAVNLSCIDNGYSAEECDGWHVGTDGKSLVPNKVAYAPTITASRGAWDDRAIGEASEIDCETPVDGADVCCSQCDWSLGVAVSKYGAGERITCDPLGDRLVECAGFVAKTDRSDEHGCEDALGTGDCEVVPSADRMRELHPAARAALGERIGHACRSNSECRDLDGLGLVGAECIGTNAADQACALDVGDPACTAGRCRAPWFVECRADPDTTGPTGYCVDARHDADASAACWQGPGVAGCTSDETCRASQCDADADGKLTAAECCGGTACDPVADIAGIYPRDRYDRKDTLPGEARALDCGDWFHLPPPADARSTELEVRCQPTDTCKVNEGWPPREMSICRDGRCRTCAVAIEDEKHNDWKASCKDCDSKGGDCKACDDATATFCAVQGDLVKLCSEGEHGNDWAINFVTKLGGVIYDPALKGVEWRPADLGGTPRALIEQCAEERGLIAARNITDGWRAHDADGIAVEHEGEWDLGMCSSSVYEIEFADPGKHAEYVRDKVGNTLEGKSTYVFETPAFHVVPDSGFPNDSLRIGACDTFSLSFSNKYDLSPGNLDKLVVLDVTDGGAVPVAGGQGCARDREELAARPDAQPCLTVNVEDQPRGVVHARIDPVQFGSVLEPGRQYQLSAPGLDAPLPRDASPAELDAWTAAEAGYAAAFWDVCGMPLVPTYRTDAGYELEYGYTFTVDPPRCEDDEDGDAVQLSCDNAPSVYNPEQSDADFDGVGDAVDPCPASPEIASETGDSDRDGVGNGCDNCARATSRYNERAGALALSPELLVRNIPYQGDADEDGIGDACDNCPTIANCSGYDVAHPWRLGDPIDPDTGTCQRDADDDMVGDACVDMQSETAAGPVGLGDVDDFDQDGIVNAIDACPRQPLADAIACDADTPCPESRLCENGDLDDATPGICDHLDSDGDGVGDICDTCPRNSNAKQVMEGAMQEDDADGDFIGADCELGDECQTAAGPRPLAFHRVSVEGSCCTTLLIQDGDALYERATNRPLVDPDGLPVRLVCSDASCRAL